MDPYTAPAAPQGLLLLNLGTPDSASIVDVRRYLREFLSDPRVIDLPAPLRWALLRLFILPFRPRATAAAYAKIWTSEGSPLRVHSEHLRRALAERLGPSYRVELGMRYGRPDIVSALGRLARAGVKSLVVLPLFPQFAVASTGSAVARVRAQVERDGHPFALDVVEPFYAHPEFIGALAERTAPELARFEPDHVLMSYHGLPERHIRRGDTGGRHCLARPDCCDAILAANRNCYRAQCFATARALGRALRLAPERYGVSFQSRLGRSPWIRPYTDHVLPELASRGVRRLAVVCPAFVADCLETLEEIEIRARDQWRALGGEALHLVPCLNADVRWAAGLERLIRARTHPRAG